MADKKYENRYWLVNDDVFELHFTPFYEDKVVLKFTRDKEDAECFWYVSEFLKVEHDCLFAVNSDEAKEDFENMIIDRINGEIAYYGQMIEKFEETVD